MSELVNPVCACPPFRRCRLRRRLTFNVMSHWFEGETVSEMSNSFGEPFLAWELGECEKKTVQSAFTFLDSLRLQCE